MGKLKQAEARYSEAKAAFRDAEAAFYRSPKANEANYLFARSELQFWLDEVNFLTNYDVRVES